MAMAFQPWRAARKHSSSEATYKRPRRRGADEAQGQDSGPQGSQGRRMGPLTEQAIESGIVGF